MRKHDCIQELLDSPNVHWDTIPPHTGRKFLEFDIDIANKEDSGWIVVLIKLDKGPEDE